MKKFLIAAAAVVFGIYAVSEAIKSERENGPRRQEVTKAAPRAPGAPHASGPLIPHKAEVVERRPPIKISFEVEVDAVNGRLPTEEELGAISRNLVESDAEKFNRAFVLFYLPGMKRDAGAFATAHHNPEMEVEILPPAFWPEKYQRLAGYDPNPPSFAAGPEVTPDRTGAARAMEAVYQELKKLSKEVEKARTYSPQKAGEFGRKLHQRISAVTAKLPDDRAFMIGWGMELEAAAGRLRSLHMFAGWPDHYSEEKRKFDEDMAVARKKIDELKAAAKAE